MQRRFQLGPDRHGSVTAITIGNIDCTVEVNSPRLKLPVISFGNRDSTLKLVEEAAADKSTCPHVAELCRQVAAYLLQPTANG